ncbi:NAD(P)H-hydrate dehydratase [Brachybacterium sp. YJGR34]|uniref:NAD(P)H-hydrate dehydratase n=1 Tax=Brachybacterium sp. YJGR34 TaxID=2059911 RepID=UPI000E0A3F3A|nr:NAD(P)H-hydrate dehydratase [Brachybacterium sp. YJGR34]
MIRAHSAEQVRAAEAPLLAAGDPLMLRAARALAERTRRRLAGAPAAGPRVLVLAGSGANGGDGLHAAALLRREGIGADAILTAERHHTGGAAALEDAGGTLHALDDLTPEELAELLAGAELVLDAILGIGGRPAVPPPLRPLLEAVRCSAVPVLAVDLPSFVDATTGETAPEALRAAETVTFGALKAGALLPGGAERCGELHLVDLGLAPHLGETPSLLRLEDADVRVLFPHPPREATKYSRGVVALAAGSEQYPGAAVLAASGAARAGAGMVRCLAPQSVLDLVLRERPEVVGHPVQPTTLDPSSLHLEDTGRIGALVVGPGLPGTDPRARAGAALLCRGDRFSRGVLDAGALEAIGAEDRFGPDVVLTPHAGEAARLARRLGADPDRPPPLLAAALASLTGATVLLKGPITVIAPGDGGPLRSQEDGTAQLASAGTGDVLAGVLGTLLAAGLPGPDAAAVAAILHGRAGRLASRDGLVPLVALEVAGRLPDALATILAPAPQ